VWFAVVAIRAGDVKLVRNLLPRAIQVVFVRDLVHIDASWDVVFVKDDVVRERLVVHEFDDFAFRDSDRWRVKAEFTVVTAQFDRGSKRWIDHEDSRTNDGSLLRIETDEEEEARCSCLVRVRD